MSDSLSKDLSVDEYQGQLEGDEIWWREHYVWLLQQGYRLRSRYDPDWIPSWHTSKQRPVRCEDFWRNPVPRGTVNDAIQLSDGQHVVLKRISKDSEPHELHIMRQFSQDALSSNPRNHCVPLLNSFPTPEGDDDMAVIPLLRDYDDPSFDTIGEIVDFVHQIIEGFAYLHEHRVAHRDVKGGNILMDPTGLGIRDFHFCRPWHSADGKKEVVPDGYRTGRWPRYFIIDYGHSSSYSPDQMPPMEPILWGTDTSVPEFNNPNLRGPFNPFLVDVYYVGNLIRTEVLEGPVRNPRRQGYRGLDFLWPLVDAMTKEDPEERTSMAEALTRLEAIISDLPSSTLRAYPPRVGSPHLSTISWVLGSISHWIRKLIYILLRTPPVPKALAVPPSPESESNV